MAVSGLAVRSYVKWAVDPGSFQKTQAQYQSHLAKLQKIGIDSTKKANAAIMGQHKIFVEQMNEIQKEKIRMILEVRLIEKTHKNL